MEMEDEFIGLISLLLVLKSICSRDVRMKTQYNEIEPYTTKDGSTIRELMHPTRHGNRNQSLAEATVPVGSKTLLHSHQQAEELYHITAGSGEMVVGGERFSVAAGDTICITPRTPHQIANTGTIPLKILCCCSPAYDHEDTELL
jgi:mannose-6-phosphate isomerase-like protein (cupin superfamily)